MSVGRRRGCVGPRLGARFGSNRSARSEGAAAFLSKMSAQAGVDQAAFEKEFLKSVRPSSLLKRFATTGEVASIVTYLASPLASATTGSAVRVDGGVIRAIL